jgi:hypothetical protein
MLFVNQIIEGRKCLEMYSTSTFYTTTNKRMQYMYARYEEACDHYSIFCMFASSQPSQDAVSHKRYMTP